MKTKTPFHIVPGEWRRPAQVVFGVANVALATVTLRPIVSAPDEAVLINGVGVDLVRAPTTSATVPDAQPDRIEDPLAIVGLLPFNNTRLGIMTTLMAVLGERANVWVETAPPNDIHVYVGDATEGSTSDQLIADVNAMQDDLRPMTSRMHVHPYSARPEDLVLPELSTAEFAQAVYGRMHHVGTVVALRSALPRVLGFEFHRPNWGDVLAHVATSASPDVVNQVERVLPELIGPGLTVRVARSGNAIPGLVRERPRT